MCWNANFPEAQAIAALSGPNLAKELAQKQPSASVIASKDPKAAKILQDLFLNGYFRPYISDDILGVQLCGALKKLLCPCDRDDFGSGAW